MDISHPCKCHNHHHPHLRTPTNGSRLAVTRVPSVPRWVRILFVNSMKSAVLVVHGIHSSMLIIGQCINTVTDALESCNIGINPMTDALAVELALMPYSIHWSMLIISWKSKEGGTTWYGGGEASEVEAISLEWGERRWKVRWGI